MHLLLCQSPFNFTEVDGIGPLIVIYYRPFILCKSVKFDFAFVS